MHNCYMEKILSNNNKEEMEELRKVFDKAMYKLKEVDEDEYEHLEMCLYKAAHGKVLTEEMAKKIIMEMHPYGMKWTLEQTKAVQAQHGLSETIGYTRTWGGHLYDCCYSMSKTRYYPFFYKSEYAWKNCVPCCGYGIIKIYTWRERCRETYAW